MKRMRQSSRQAMTALPSQKPVKASSSPKTLPSSIVSSTVRLPSGCRRTSSALPESSTPIISCCSPQTRMVCPAVKRRSYAPKHVSIFRQDCSSTPAKRAESRQSIRSPPLRLRHFSGAARPLVYCLIIYHWPEKVNDKFVKICCEKLRLARQSCGQKAKKHPQRGILCPYCADACSPALRA